MKKSYIKPAITEVVAANTIMAATSLPVAPSTGSDGEEITDPDQELGKKNGFWENDED